MCYDFGLFGFVWKAHLALVRFKIRLEMIFSSIRGGEEGEEICATFKKLCAEDQYQEGVPVNMVEMCLCLKILEKRKILHWLSWPKTSSQKLGRCASRRVRSVRKSLGQIKDLSQKCLHSKYLHTCILAYFRTNFRKSYQDPRYFYEFSYWMF